MNDTTPETPPGMEIITPEEFARRVARCEKPAATPPAAQDGGEPIVTRYDRPLEDQDHSRMIPRPDGAWIESVHYDHLASQLAQAQEEAKKFRDMYLAEWQENEAALENAGVDFTPDEHGGKPVIAGIVELRDARDSALAQLTAARKECERLRKDIDDYRAAAKHFKDSRDSALQDRDQLRAEKEELVALLDEGEYIGSWTIERMREWDEARTKAIAKHQQADNSTK